MYRLIECGAYKKFHHRYMEIIIERCTFSSKNICKEPDLFSLETANITTWFFI